LHTIEYEKFIIIIIDGEPAITTNVA